MVTILEAATLAGVSKDRARYWLKLLDIETVKKDGKLLFPGNTTDLLIAMKKTVESGLAPVAAAVEVKNVYSFPTVQDFHQETPKQNDIVLDKIADLQNAIMLLAGTVEKQNKLIETQAKQIKLLTARLPAPELPRLLNVWEPQPRQVLQVSFLRRIWLELFNPVVLRAAS